MRGRLRSQEFEENLDPRWSNLGSRGKDHVSLSSPLDCSKTRWIQRKLKRVVWEFVGENVFPRSYGSTSWATYMLLKHAQLFVDPAACACHMANK